MFCWGVSNSNTVSISLEKTVQLFHGMVTKGVNQLLGDPNCEASQCLRDCYSRQTTSGVGANDLYLTRVNFIPIFMNYLKYAKNYRNEQILN